MWREVPDVRQRYPHDCGHAAARALFAAHGVGPRSLGSDLSNPVQGMSPDTLEAVLWRGFGSLARGTLRLADLAYFCRTGRPVACPVSHGGGHWIVAWKVTRTRVFFQCPDRGPQSRPLAEWDRDWHDSANGVAYTRFGICPWVTPP